MSTESESDEVDPAKVNGIVVRPELLTVHALAVQRVCRAHQRQVALDAEVLVVAGHAPYWHRKATSLIEVQIVVATCLVLAHAKRVTHEIAGHEDEIGTPILGNSPKLLQANEALRTDVRVRRVDEGEGRGGRSQPGQSPGARCWKLTEPPSRTFRRRDDHREG